MLSIVGVFITKEILITYFNVNNKEESKFCSVNKEFSCNTIIQSKSYAFSKYVEFVDLPIIFFSFSFLGLIFGINIVSIIVLISSFSLPVIAFSIYLQKIVLKKWCLLCLIVSFILILNVLFYLLNYNAVNYEIKNILIGALFLAVVSVLWFFVKSKIKDLNANKNELRQLIRFKRREEIFYKIADAVNNKQELLALNKISIGNNNSKNGLILFLSPSCPHCHVAFKEALDLVSKYPEKVKLNIAYNLSINNTDNPYLEVAKTIIALYKDNLDFLNALKDWHVNKMELKDWTDKWELDYNALIVNEILEKQLQWCELNDFNYVPVKIFNEVLVPNEYRINELLYFFKE
ncbi:thioredoxin domain-containing protein [Flavobacterium jejuense]|uniref:Thioredoxin domain-containing protein n=1 Tax=Flavobacterium jejuense TaxID=1544455 RepID=A0ABX0IS41_9FLAO|nr:vitamin K epoxide reductase family protein [Flavobacterium jejuense]NHN26675.1 thioredoxin domain-containing protein [Flavobacterium jejuense]